MSRTRPISKNIYWVGVNDRETDIFESLWPIPDGVSYNSYLICDQKNALIDTVRIGYQQHFIDNIKNLLGEEKLDYLIINHMEPDHSGSVKALKQVFPDLKIVGNKKTMNFLEGFYGINENLVTVSNEDEIDLGEHQLKFYITPMLHWPETMMTYEKTDKILFSGDAFGSFGSLDGGIFDDEVDINHFDNEIRRYYANIVGKYSPIVQRTLPKLADLELETICATHGPIWRENPGYIVDKYDELSSYQTEKGVVIIYGTMYGNTKSIAEEIASSLIDEGMSNIKIFDAARTHLSYLLSAIWKYQGLILGSCTYNNEIFPPIASLVSALENRAIRKHKIGIFGSYSWSGGAVDKINDFAQNGSWDLITPVIETQYSPDIDTDNTCKMLAKNFVNELND